MVESSMAESLVVRVSESILMKLSSTVTIMSPRFFLNWGRLTWNWPLAWLTLCSRVSRASCSVGRVWVSCR
ncbi:hypothetical protein D3C87_675720 [compost metagenome]